MINLKDLKRRLDEELSKETEESLTEFINQVKSREITKTPSKEQTQLQEECGANWQLITNGTLGKLRCRHCGVYVVNGGTPKCLKKI